MAESSDEVFWLRLCRTMYENTIPVPWDLKPGKYRLRVALLDPATRTPVIQLAIAGRQSDGWYELGDITVD